MEISFASSGGSSNVDLASRRAEKLASLESLRTERAAAKEARAQNVAAASASSGLGTVDQFWAALTSGCKALRDAITQACAVGTASNEAAAQGLLDSWTAQVSEQQGHLNDSLSILPAFDVRKAQALLDETTAEIEAARAAIMPRKRFTFSLAAKKAATAAASSSSTSASASGSSNASPPAANSPESKSTDLEKLTSVLPLSSSSATARASSSSSSTSSSSSSSSSSGSRRWEDGEETIQDLKDSIIIIRPGHFSVYNGHPPVAEVGSATFGTSCSTPPSPPPPAASLERARDLRLQRLERSTLLLLDVTRAIRIDGCRDCTIIAGPTSGSVLLHDCVGCTFALISQQARLHTSADCTFFLLTGSQPIIEHCTRLSFSPYPFTFPGLKEELKVAGLASFSDNVSWLQQKMGGGTGAAGEGHLTPAASMHTPTSAAIKYPIWCSQWRSVNDFGWHRTQKSPNWRILPMEERPTALSKVTMLGAALAVTSIVSSTSSSSGSKSFSSQQLSVVQKVGGEGVASKAADNSPALKEALQLGIDLIDTSSIEKFSGESGIAAWVAGPMLAEEASDVAAAAMAAAAAAAAASSTAAASLAAAASSAAAAAAAAAATAAAAIATTLKSSSSSSKTAPSTESAVSATNRVAADSSPPAVATSHLPASTTFSTASSSSPKEASLVETLMPNAASSASGGAKPTSAPAPSVSSSAQTAVAAVAVTVAATIVAPPKVVLAGGEGKSAATVVRVDASKRQEEEDDEL